MHERAARAWAFSTALTMPDREICQLQVVPYTCVRRFAPERKSRCGARRRDHTPGSLMDSSNPQKKGGAETPPSLGRKRPRMWKADLANHEKIATGTAWMLQRRKNSITMMIYTSTTYGSRENADCAAKTEPGFRYAHCPAERREQIVLSA